MTWGTRGTRLRATIVRWAFGGDRHKTQPHDSVSLGSEHESPHYEISTEQRAAHDLAFRRAILSNTDVVTTSAPNGYSIPLWRLAARVRLGTAGWRDVESFGLEQLALGDDSAATVDLASISANVDTVEVEELVDRAMYARGLSWPSIEDSTRSEIFHLAALVARGRKNPLSAAQMISTLVLYSDNPIADIDDETAPIWTTVYAYEDSPDMRDVFEVDLRRMFIELDSRADS
jgi:hypothetical protein